MTHVSVSSAPSDTNVAKLNYPFAEKTLSSKTNNGLLAAVVETEAIEIRKIKGRQDQIESSKRRDILKHEPCNTLCQNLRIISGGFDIVVGGGFLSSFFSSFPSFFGASCGSPLQDSAF